MEQNLISTIFNEQTGLIALRVFQLGFNLWAIEANDGNTYHLTN